jgi:hypothetical protein
MSELHHRNHRSKTHRSKHSASGKVEKYITKHFFRFLGIAFFIAGAIFLFRQMKPGHSFLSTILSFFSSVGAEETAGNISFPFNGWKVLFQLLPGFVLLLLPFFLYKKYPSYARISALTGTLWLLGVNIKVLSLDFISTSSCYPTLLAAMTVTSALCLLPLWHAYKLKSSSLLVTVILLFYISLLFITNDYQWHYYQDFLFLLLFTGLVIFICQKTGNLVPFYLQAFLSILLVAVFWIRRMLVRDSADPVSTYIIISSLFYIVICVSGMLINLSRRNVIYELAATLLMLVNTLFYWGSVLYVLHRYGHPDMQGLFTLALTLFSGMLLYFSPKFNPGLFRNPYIFMTIFLLSMILPLWAQQNYVILAASVFSVLLVVYSQYSKNRSALVVSMASVAILVMMFIYKWIIMYFPGLYAGAFPADRVLFYNGFQAAIFTLFALFFNHLLIKNLERPLPGSWFSRHRYRAILKILLIVVLYISGFWCWHFLFSMLFPIAEAMLFSWYSFTCLFFLILIPALVTQKSSLLKPVLVTTGLALLLYPFLINFSMITIRNIGLTNGGLWSSCFIAHYFLLPVILGLMAILYYYLKKSWSNQRYAIRMLRIFIAGMLLSMVLLEYDHFTIFFGFAGNADPSVMTERNHHLPWSVILFIFSLSLIVFGLARKQRFIPQLSIVLLLATVAKILVYDFAFLGETARIAVLFILGGFMIAFSFFYQRFRKAVAERKSRKVSGNV